MLPSYAIRWNLCSGRSKKVPSFAVPVQKGERSRLACHTKLIYGLATGGRPWKGWGLVPLSPATGPTHTDRFHATKIVWGCYLHKFGFGIFPRTASRGEQSAWSLKRDISTYTQCFGVLFVFVKNGAGHHRAVGNSRCPAVRATAGGRWASNIRKELLPGQAWFFRMLGSAKQWRSSFSRWPPVSP